MALANFTDLQSALLSWSERSDLTSLTTDFISLADSRIKKKFGEVELRVRDMETTADATPSSGVATIPSNFIAMIRVQARTSPPRRLEYKPQDWLDEAYPNVAEDHPSFYSTTGFDLRMYPLTTSDIRMTYWAYPALLTAAAPTNWLMTKFPDVYLYAGLIELELYAQNDSGAQRWATAFDVAVESLKNGSKSDSITAGTSKTASIGAQ